MACGGAGAQDRLMPRHAPMPLCLILMAEPTATSTRVAHILLSVIAFLPSKQQPLITAIPNT